MPTFTITVTTTDEESNKVNAGTMSFDLESIRKTPNPRQALTAHFMAMTRKVIAEVDPSISI